MMRTITLGTHVSVQGLLVEQLANGNIVVEVDDKRYTGKPATPVASVKVGA